MQCHGMAWHRHREKNYYGRTFAQNVDDIVDEAGTWWKTARKKEILTTEVELVQYG